jgi:hypothetical protein
MRLLIVMSLSGAQFGMLTSGVMETVGVGLCKGHNVWRRGDGHVLRVFVFNLELAGRREHASIAVLHLTGLMVRATTRKFPYPNFHSL